MPVVIFSKKLTGAGLLVLLLCDLIIFQSVLAVWCNKINCVKDLSFQLCLQFYRSAGSLVHLQLGSVICVLSIVVMHCSVDSLELPSLFFLLIIIKKKNQKSPIDLNSCLDFVISFTMGFFSFCVLAEGYTCLLFLSRISQAMFMWRLIIELFS